MSSSNDPCIQAVQTCCKCWKPGPTSDVILNNSALNKTTWSNVSEKLAMFPKTIRTSIATSNIKRIMNAFASTPPESPNALFPAERCPVRDLLLLLLEGPRVPLRVRDQPSGESVRLQQRHGQRRPPEPDFPQHYLFCVV